MKPLWSVLSLAIVLSCAPTVNPHPPIVIREGEDPCEAAGRRLADLQCYDRRGRPLWVSTDSGTGKTIPYASVCKDALLDGKDWHPACIAKVADCSQVDRAYRSAECPF